MTEHHSPGTDTENKEERKHFRGIAAGKIKEIKGLRHGCYKRVVKPKQELWVMMEPLIHWLLTECSVTTSLLLMQFIFIFIDGDFFNQ